MRRSLDRYLSKCKNKNILLLHADMWSFPEFKTRYPDRCLNFGIQETNMVNVAGGLAREGKSVIVYGVAGFVYQRGYEQLKFSVVNYGKSVTFVNAGANGCYNRCGIGHIPDDDYALMSALDVRCHEPDTRSGFIKTLSNCIRSRETNFIRLGWDNCEW